MPRSSRHRSHKQSKHASKNYSDSEEDVNMKDKSSKSENLIKGRDSLSGEKRTISSLIREGKEGKDQIGHGNGEASEEYFSSKRRKEKGDVAVGGDRWNGGGDERGSHDRIAEKETIKGEGLMIEPKSKEFSNKGDSVRMESKDKNKKYESGGVSEFKEESLSSAMLEKEDGKSKGESKRKSEKEYSVRKEGKEYKDKDRRVEKERERDREKEKEKEKEKSLGQEIKRRDTEVKLMDMDVGKKQVPQLGDQSEGRQVKRSRESTDCPVQDELKNPDLEKENDKRLHRRRESSKDRGVHHDDFKEYEERGLSSRSDRSKDVKYRDEKHKDRTYSDRYHEDGHKHEGHRDEKYIEETKKDNKHYDDKYGEDDDKDAKRRDDRHRGDGVRENRPKDERHRERERDTKRKDDKYREGSEKDDRHRDYRHHEDSERDSRRRDDHYREDGDKDGRLRDGRYYEDFDRDDRRREHKYKEDGHEDNRTKEENHRENNERGSRHKDGKQGDDFDREKRVREAKYREELTSGNRSGDKSDPRDSIDDVYTADHHSKKSSAYDDSPTHNDQSVRHRDDQGRRKADDREDSTDVRSRSTKDQRFDAEKKMGTSVRMESVPDRGRSTSRNAELELNSSHGRRRSSPSSNSLAPRDHYRPSKHDEFRYRDYGYEERLRHNMTASKDYTGTLGVSEKTLSSRSLEKLGQKEDGHLRELSAERRLISDIHSSPLKLLDKSPSSSADRRQFNRSNVRLGNDIEESTQRSVGSRDMKDYYGKEIKESRDLGMDRLPGDELLQADADTVSVSSPLVRNNNLSSSSKSFPPPHPHRTGVDSPLISGSIEDDTRYRSNSRFRRSGDPNFGRIQGNAWRGVPSWPSPVANGFMSFPHAPPPVGFHSVMQPFAAPPMFGIRPSMDLNHPAPYHISDAERFSGPVRPMGWHNAVDERPPLHAWDASNTVFRDESHIYGRPAWDHSRNLPGGRGWDTTEDMWKAPNKTANFEMPSHEKDNNFTQNVDEMLDGQSVQPSENEQIGPGQQAVSTADTQLTYGTEINAAEAPQIISDTSDIAKLSKKDDVPLCHVYLSRIDISADLTERELFRQCAGFTDVDQIVVSDVDDSKILLIEETLEDEVPTHQILSHSLPAALDDSVFQRAMSLYKRQKDDVNKVVDGEKSFIPSLPIPKADQEDLNMEDEKSKKLSAISYMQGAEVTQSNVIMELTPPKSYPEDECCTKFSLQNPDIPCAYTMIKSGEPVPTIDHVNEKVDLAATLLPHCHIVEDKPSSAERVEGPDAHPTATDKVKNDGNVEELMLVDTKHDTLLNSDVCSDAFEAMMPESVVSESVNLSRIHHSPESTH